MARVVIVGAGPAGIAAAAALAEQGIAPVLVDEAERPGGQGYRSPDPRLAGRGYDPAEGPAARDHARVHALFAAHRERIDYRPRTLAWHVEDGALHTAPAGGGAVEAVGFDALVLATGAVDRIMPVPGWTLPGVFSLGGAQVILKDQACLVGRRVVFAGASPLLYLAALQCVEAGGTVAAVLDTTPFAAKLAALPGLMAAPGLLGRGVSFLLALRARGVPVVHGAQGIEALGAGAVEAVRFRRAGGAPAQVACDALALGHGLKAETQLAELAGCTLAYDATFAQWLPECDADGRAGKGVYVAGDGARIGGALAAEIAGRLAGLAVAEDLGRLDPAAVAAERGGLRRRHARLLGFQRALARAFAWPGAAGGAVLPDDLPVCRCEHVTAGELRRAAGALTGLLDLNRVKAATRCGMGRCQGRMCGPAAASVVAAASGAEAAAVGRLRAQHPVKPLPVPAPSPAQGEPVR